MRAGGVRDRVVQQPPTPKAESAGHCARWAAESVFLLDQSENENSRSGFSCMNKDIWLITESSGFVQGDTHLVLPLSP